MHELSIAQAVLAVAVRNAGDARITAVHLRIGRLRQVVPSALTFAFELSAQGTTAESAELELEDVAIVADCPACGTRSDQDGLPLRCPTCGGLRLDVVTGDELQVDALELEHAGLSTSGDER